MPKKNPKRSSQAKRRRYELKQQYRTEKRDYRYLKMGIVAVGVIGAVVALIMLNQEEAQVRRLKEGDEVTFEYTLWTCDDNFNYNYSQPHQDSEFQVVVTPDNLIYGFYQNVIGMEEGEVRTFNLDACIDADSDGYDDNTGDRCETYGDPSHELYNTNLRFRVRLVRFENE